MNSTINAELQNVFNQDKISGSERNKIIAICNQIVDDANFMTEVQNGITTVVNRQNFKLENNLALLVQSILTVLNTVQFYKDVSSERTKYILYCALISSLYKFYPNLLKTVEIDLIRTLFCDVFDLLMIIPETVKITKASCLTCVGKSFKLFSFLNKDKLLI